MNYSIKTPGLPFFLRLNVKLAVVVFVLMAARPPAEAAPVRSRVIAVSVPAPSPAIPPAPPPTIDAYFEKIRTNRAALRAFFSQMPKGGDLHNHLTGSIYGESWLNFAIDQKLWVNLQTLALSQQPSSPAPAGTWVRIDSFSTQREWPALKQRLLQDWSIKDFYPGFAAPDQHFFDAFGKFPRLSGWDDIHRALMQLKQRALAENVQYLEIMLGACPFNFDLSSFKNNEPALRAAASMKDTATVFSILQQLYDVMQAEATRSAMTFSEELTAMHKSSGHEDRGPDGRGLDDAGFTMRYQCPVRREGAPLDIFRSLLASFKAAELSPLVGGVNFVSREDGDLSMQDYYLHMLMFRFLHRKCPAARFSLHAGELTLGLVEPEDLTWHINDAVYVAGANRIGHGVDMPYERNSRSLMNYMVRNRTAIEINLVSNEFILGVHDDVHPVQLYADNKVPIVISTDDPGILRTNLTEQFVLLAMRYRQLRYADIRQFVLNSIEYSFIRDARLKEKVMGDLNRRLVEFEKGVVM
jgi:adenosine deaminase/adenosine deaminase CECR1